MLDHEYLEYVPAYAAGALNAAEKSKFEDHLQAGCDICEPELVICQETINRFPYSLPGKKVPDSIKKKIDQQIDALESPSVSRIRWAPVLRVAAVVAFVAFGAFFYWNQNRILDSRELEISNLEKQFELQQKEIKWLRDPSVQLAMLTGLASAPDAKGKMVWNPVAEKGMFYGDSLPPLPNGKSYQLWIIGSKGPISAGVFDPDRSGMVVLTISRISGSATGSLQFAVTIEPRGGLQQPSGAMVLAGKPL